MFSLGVGKTNILLKQIVASQGGKGLCITSFYGQSPFTCNNVTYSTATGNITASISQTTGSTWTNVTFYFLNNSKYMQVLNGTSGLVATWPHSSKIQSMPSGIPVIVNIPANTGLLPDSSSAAGGNIYAWYTTSGNTGYTHIAVVTVSAST